MERAAIQPDDLLEGPLWPERVRVLRVQALGQFLNLEVVGVQSRQLYSLVLEPESLDKITVISPARWDFQGNAEAFFLAVEASRIRLATQFDPLFAVNVSQVDPLPHQIEAVYHVILRRPRVRFLLADDPGAGKTIMAGVLLKELKHRGLVRRTLIVVPGQLTDQWRRELKERFGETFLVVDRAVMDANWGRNLWREEPQCITSMDFAKQADVREALLEALWDLVIVDEAHKLAAYRYGEKTKKTERYRLGEVLSQASQFLLFLTATPHRGDPENFRLLLELLEPDLFSSTDLLEESVNRRENPLFLRRLKEDLKDFNQRPLFPPRHVFTRAFPLSDPEKRLYNAVTEYVESFYNRALDADKRNVAFALLILQRRLASSVRAVRRSLERRRQRLGELLKKGQWLASGDGFDEEALEDAPEAERQREEDRLVEQLTAAETREELEAEIAQLDCLVRIACEAEQQEVETKLVELRRVMEDEAVRQRQEKLLIFTESYETLQYLEEKLTSWGYSVVTLHGRMNLEARIAAENTFRHRAQVMVSTEAGGEGINLQFCSLMVNYDIPWNPNRLEQRMGRIHRYGQQKEAHIYNLVAKDTREGMVLRALFEKLEHIRRAMGNDRVFDVIGEVVMGRSLKDLIVDAISRRRTLDDILQEITSLPDEEAIQKARTAALEALASRHVDLQWVLGETRRAREERLVPEYIEAFFTRACAFLQVDLEKRRDGLLRVPKVPVVLRQVSPSFKMAYGEVLREYPKLAFDKATARSKEATFVAPGHPLLESLLEAVLGHGAGALRRGAVFADPDGRWDGWLWIVQGEVRDGHGRVAGRRLFAVFQPVQGNDLRQVPSAVLWDLKPLPPAPEVSPPTGWEEVQRLVLEQALEPYRQELLSQRRREAEIRERYGLRSLDTLICRSEERLIDYETRKLKGLPVPEAEILKEQRRKEEYQRRKEQLAEDSRRDTSLTLAPPELLGVARILPQPATQLPPVSDAQVEAVGMQVAMDYERQQGRTPEDVSARKVGYDIRSTDPKGGVRYIEVKARAVSGPITLTPNEWLMAQRLGEDYWLYVVEHAATTPTLYPIQHPAAKLQPVEVSQVVRYVVEDWRSAAAPS